MSATSNHFSILACQPLKILKLFLVTLLRKLYFLRQKLYN